MKDSFFISSKQMAQSDLAEAIDSFDEAAEVCRSAEDLFLEADNPFCFGDLRLDTVPAMGVTVHLTAFKTFTVIQQIITHTNICYNNSMILGCP